MRPNWNDCLRRICRHVWRICRRCWSRRISMAPCPNWLIIRRTRRSILPRRARWQGSALIIRGCVWPCCPAAALMIWNDVSGWFQIMSFLPAIMGWNCVVEVWTGTIPSVVRCDRIWIVWRSSSGRKPVPSREWNWKTRGSRCPCITGGWHPTTLGSCSVIVERAPVSDTLRRHEGKMVVEFRPAVEWNKGYALLAIMGHLGIPGNAVIYLGDDVTDEDVFSASLKTRGSRFTLARVATPSCAHLECR